jgi:hypothetical protein
MASPANSSTQAGGSGNKKSDAIGDLMQRLGIEEDELDDLVFEEEEESAPKQGIKWMALWRRDVTIEQIISAPKYIDVKVIESPDKVWRFTGFYGELKWEDKYKSWDKLRELNGQFNLPLGDHGRFQRNSLFL